MGEIRSQDKRDKLRLLYAKTVAGGAAAGAPTLQALLMQGLTVCDAAVSGVTPGAVLLETREDSGLARFEVLGDFTPSMAKRLFGELLDLYDYVKAQLTAAGGDTGDASIYASMIDNLKPVRRYHTDFTGLRYGTGFYLGQ